MYVFVRFTGGVLIVSGLLLMVAGFVAETVYIFVPKDTLLNTLNDYLLSGGGTSVFSGAFLPFFAIIALVFFLIGMFTAAFGQLMLVFADIGSHSRETNIILRSLRRKGL